MKILFGGLRLRLIHPTKLSSKKFKFSASPNQYQFSTPTSFHQTHIKKCVALFNDK
jgi:hypothetical protein